MSSGVIDYFRRVMLHAPFNASLDAAPEWSSNYDIEAWRENEFKAPLREYRQDALIHSRAHVEDRVKSLIQSRLETFGEHPQGMGRFTRTMFAKDLRRKIEVRGRLK